MTMTGCSSCELLELVRAKAGTAGRLMGEIDEASDYDAAATIMLEWDEVCDELVAALTELETRGTLRVLAAQLKRLG
jgi:hypothetical protein